MSLLSAVGTEVEARNFDNLLIKGAVLAKHIRGWLPSSLSKRMVLHFLNIPYLSCSALKLYSSHCWEIFVMIFVTVEVATMHGILSSLDSSGDPSHKYFLKLYPCALTSLQVITAFNSCARYSSGFKLESVAPIPSWVIVIMRISLIGTSLFWTMYRKWSPVSVMNQNVRAMGIVRPVDINRINQGSLDIAKIELVFSMSIARIRRT